MLIKLKKQPCYLALADGTIFEGQALGYTESKPVIGEVVFNTALSGYQEIMTDPSYAGQIVTFTYPHIGNVGANSEDYESDKIYASGMIIREESKSVSNFRSEESLSNFLRREKVLGISGVDTRFLVQHLRDHGAQMGAISANTAIKTSELVEMARAAGSMEGKDYVKEVSCKKAYPWKESTWQLSGVTLANGTIGAGYNNISNANIAEAELKSRPHVVVLDCGIKRNILRILVEVGFNVTVLPAGSTASEILAHKPDGLFLSNGPGDPATLGYVVNPVKELIGKLPMFGICLGHQILGQALGGKTYKLKFGHRGGNHPVMDMKTKIVEISVQNHGFAVDKDSLPKDVEVSHINLNDGTVEGIVSKKHKAFAVQYHPEASPGPHDSNYLFKRFYDLVTKG